MIARDGLFTTQDEAGLGRLFFQVVGEDLIHADPPLQDGAFLERRPGEDIASLARDGCRRRWRSC